MAGEEDLVARRRPGPALPVSEGARLQRGVDADLVLSLRASRRAAAGSGKSPSPRRSTTPDRGPSRAGRATCAGAASTPRATSPPDGLAVADHVQVGAREVDHAFAPRVLHPPRRGCSTPAAPSSRRPRVPVGTSWIASGISARRRCERFADAVAGHAAADRVELGDKIVELARPSRVRRGPPQLVASHGGSHGYTFTSGIGTTNLPPHSRT